MTVPQQNYGPPPPPPQRYPPPPPPRGYPVPPPRDGRAMQVLRVVTYVLTSLASLLFIVLAIYGYVRYQQSLSALDGLLSGNQPVIPLPTFPSGPNG